MKISIFGLGYVGAISAGCLANEGHEIVGVDPNEVKVDLINNGKSPIIEKEIDGIIKNAVENRKLTATVSVTEAIMNSEMALICVGTPSQFNGSLDLRYVRRVCEQIGEALREKNDFFVVVLRSTMLPGSMKNLVIPTLEEFSRKEVGKDFGVCNNPEFLREGTAVYDFYNPPKTVIGEIDERSGIALSSIYETMDAPLIRTDVEVAEMVKYTDNTWHALKVSYANEIGTLCKSMDIDSHKVMDIFCQDKKLNISPYYMKPGFAFGGSCLPKDVRALGYKAKKLDLDLPILSHIMQSNRRHIERGFDQIVNKGNKKIGVLGFSFKAGTDDLRESPIIELIERMIGKGFDLKIYDRNVNIASLVGANRDYIMNKIPHISKLMMTTIDGVLDHAETIVIGNNDIEFSEIMTKINDTQVVVDFVRLSDIRSDNSRYDGVCW